MKNLILIVIGAMLVTSCNKTFECTNAQGIVTGEVKARNLEKAKEMCAKGSTASPK